MSSTGPLRQLAAPVERRGLLLLHGHPPVGQVLHGGLARHAPATWITGVVSFLVSVGAAFTGYLSQQNFDSQWISTQAKDGINSTGAGAIFNVTQLRPDADVAHRAAAARASSLMVGVHVLLVRRQGVVPPFAPRVSNDDDGRASRRRPPLPADGRRSDRHERRHQGERRRFNPDRDVEASGTGATPPTTSSRSSSSPSWRWRSWSSAWPWSSPRPTSKPVTVKSWSTSDPVDFAQTAITELDGTSGTATYGPPYNARPDASPARSARSSARAAGSASTTRSTPPRTSSSTRCRRCPTSPSSQAAVTRYQLGVAGPAGRVDRRLREGGRPTPPSSDGTLHVPAGDYGPVGTIDRLADRHGPERRASTARC